MKKSIAGVGVGGGGEVEGGGDGSRCEGSEV